MNATTGTNVAIWSNWLAGIATVLAGLLDPDVLAQILGSKYGWLAPFIIMIVNALAHTVDPSVRQRFVQRLLVGHAAASRLLMKANQQFRLRLVALSQPLAELGSRVKECWLHAFTTDG